MPNIRRHNVAGAWTKLIIWLLGTAEPEASPSISAGSGAPTDDEPDGSLYLRTDGDGVASAYVRENDNWRPLEVRGAAVSVDMADAAHALVFGAAGAGQTELTGTTVFVDPASTGGTEDLTLPAEASSVGLQLTIVNTADAAEDVVVKDDGGSTIITLSQNEAGLVVCDGTTWRGFVGAAT